MEQKSHINHCKNELDNLYCRIVNDRAKRIYDSDTIDFDAIIEAFKNAENHERPDGLIVLNDTVYMVEHFQNSLYWLKGKDRLKAALNPKNTRGTYLGVTVGKQSNQGAFNDINDLLSMWLQGFKASLEKHMKQYDDYLKNAEAMYPNKTYKFILLVEDNSFSIISDDDLNLLDVTEFVKCILEYQKIDGVIVYKSNTRGSAIIAKDRINMALNAENNVLRLLNQCDIISMIEEVFSPDQRQEVQEQICRILGVGRDEINVKDGVTVFDGDKIIADF